MVETVTAPCIESVTLVTDTVVSCCGKNQAMGHPLVYLNMSNEGNVVCPYCSHRFILGEEPLQNL